MDRPDGDLGPFEAVRGLTVEAELPPVIRVRQALSDEALPDVAAATAAALEPLRARIRPGMRIGTASVRRKAQLLALEPSLSIEPLRGNIDTRLRKRGERGLDAIVLAACGLDRLGLGHEIGHRFEPETMLPEAGQGALALQVRAGDVDLVAATDDPETRERVEAERAVVATVGGGCLAPVAAHHDGTTLTGLVAAEDGSWIERRTGDDPAALGAELADASSRHA